MSKIHRLPAVMQVTGLSKASIYLGIKKGTFPAPVKLGERSVGWPSEAIEGWVKSRPTAAA
ncbi:helix-turn-helix transcriptional regulator [Falsigemmobacter intermedius]|uniref:AlpA family transcriptional regulator n=1 Tax=Falsigemmobacter intermedius TaxID=1553448 RepID=A0A3S3YDW2_9RHOB|nr:AlpA family transcriptional regulator [Falsigemmobacter intermedius]RWY38752.1 AlpA family transcriptional regulator [Falsigemmobacter intermedius]